MLAGRAAAHKFASVPPSAARIATPAGATDWHQSTDVLRHSLVQILAIS